MASELSSNWKKLQAKIKAESSNKNPSASSSSSKEQSSGASLSEKRKSGVSPDQGTASKKRNLGGGSSQTSRPKQQQQHLNTSKEGKSRRRPATMGVTQSSAVVKGTSATVSPSLALWAKENDITAEDLAEAYGLGTKRSGMANYGVLSNSDIKEDKNRVGEGLAPGVEVGKYIALDCEMVGVGPSGLDHMLARVSCVDFHGKQVYDSFVIPRPGVAITDYRTSITGITPSTLRGPTARPFEEVQAAVADLLKGRILVGHDLRHDLAVLELKHPAPQIRDTSLHSSFRQYGHGPKPALRVLANKVLGLDDFHTGTHSSVEDARVAMLLFRMKKSEFDVMNANKFGVPPDDSMSGSGRHGISKLQGKKKQKKKR
ncbi:ribonuclease H-like domain-containing protein [Poronia punctata]|nr:ribonuclease H-like domain-containing protein [Poronia punctata]